MTTYQTSADVVAAIRDELLARASNLTVDALIPEACIEALAEALGRAWQCSDIAAAVEAAIEGGSAALYAAGQVAQGWSTEVTDAIAVELFGGPSNPESPVRWPWLDDIHGRLCPGWCRPSATGWVGTIPGTTYRCLVTPAAAGLDVRPADDAS
ncbi:MAG: hypothetical protein KatS3mg064_0611 [Tepidiforma sp.]|nr:hypothetical protein [Tepidiforma sp.]GIW17454.1 MAG: hypothetical protein KatS3mg064_0611 [Tepidiforma sp.]